MDAGPFDWEELVTASEPLIDVDGYGRVRKCKAPVDADPNFVNHRSNQVVAFRVGGTGNFPYKVDGSFLDE